MAREAGGKNLRPFFLYYAGESWAQLICRIATFRRPYLLAVGLDKENL